MAQADTHSILRIDPRASAALRELLETLIERLVGIVDMSDAGFDDLEDAVEHGAR